MQQLGDGLVIHDGTEVDPLVVACCLDPRLALPGLQTLQNPEIGVVFAMPT